MLPILIVGQGIAGTMLAFHLMKAGKEIVVLDKDGVSISSKVAAGLYNPVTGRRMVKTWLADSLFPYALQVYKELEEDLGISIIQDKNFYKPFKDVEEQNDLLSRSLDPKFQGYLNTELETSTYSSLIEDDFGGIEVLRSGNVNLNPLLDTFRKKLIATNSLVNEHFDETQLEFGESVSYKGINYEKVILCQGSGAVKNKYFNWLPFSLTKGEILEVDIPEFPSTHILNKGFFILPKKKNRFIVGSTYDLNLEGGITEKGLNQLKVKLDGLLKVPYEIIEHKYGIRPTVKDRRPLIGRHPKNETLFIFNGFGTKGVTLSPYFAQEFVEFLFEGKAINKEANIERFYSLY